jgi:hypothetical protein
LSIRLSAMCPIYNGSLILQTARGARGVTLRSRESRLAGSRMVRAASSTAAVRWSGCGNSSQPLIDVLAVLRQGCSDLCWGVLELKHLRSIVFHAVDQQAGKQFRFDLARSLDHGALIRANPLLQAFGQAKH